MNRRHTSAGAGRHGRMVLWSFMLVVAGTLLLPLSGYLYTGLAGTPVEAAAPAEEAGAAVNPRSNYWRAVREGRSGYSAASGPYTTDNLVMSRGEEWRNLRNGYVTVAVLAITGATLALIVLFHLIKGPKRLEQPLSGRTLPRWSGGERLLHWYTAVLFIVLALTGFSLLYGRAALVPLLGLEGFAAYATVAKAVHNYAGPLFLVGVAIEVITWMRMNTFRSYDLVWLKRLGGMLRAGEHPPAGRANAGEKVWFWFIATAGLLGVGISGLVLDFPNFGQSRETMQTANLIHSVLSGLWMAIAFGHIYLGTLGVRGTLSGMTTGRVSEEWMKQHHGLWYEQLKRGAAGEEQAPAARKPPGVAPAPRGPGASH